MKEHEILCNLFDLGSTLFETKEEAKSALLKAGFIVSRGKLEYYMPQNDDYSGWVQAIIRRSRSKYCSGKYEIIYRFWL